ncbi:MAG: nitroreductase [Comamonadaceae bacterium]|nr:MAG: nitroreductase [Comamonadaceae bacterium]
MSTPTLPQDPAGLGAVTQVSQAIRRRGAVRAFLPRAVPRNVLQELLRTACCAPSGGNLQPWHVHMLTGPALARLKLRMASYLEAGGGSAPEFEVYPPQLWEPLRQRRRDAGALRYAALGVGDKDAGANQQLLRDNAAFFGAPVGLFFCTDRRVGSSQWLDVGLLMQNVMLLAVEQGLDTCPQAVWSNWPQVLRETLALGEYEVVVAGMSLGFRDPDAAINQFRTSRAGLGEVATFHHD